MAAGHVIECGIQATGGNFSFFTEVADLGYIRLPARRDPRRRIVGDHQAPGTGGQVSVDTVTAQLLYEITGARAEPDVTLRVDSMELSTTAPTGADRRCGGEPPPPTLKVSLNSIGGFRNAMTFVLTGLDIDAKADLVQRQLEAGLSVKPAELEWTLARTDHPDADTEEAASALLHCVVRPGPANVGRQFSSAAVELALASYPGFHVTAPPGEGQVYGVFTPGYVDAGEVPHVAVHADGSHRSRRDRHPELAPVAPSRCPNRCRPGRRGAPLGRSPARGGDKGGSANVGVWVRTDEQWRWLAHTLTVEKLRELLPETADLPVTRHLLPNLRAVNFVIDGILGEGVAYQARFDPAGQGAGRVAAQPPVDIPESLLCEHLAHTRTRAAAKDGARVRRTRGAAARRRVGAHRRCCRELHRKAGDAGLLGAGCPRRSAAGAATAPTR